MDIRIDEINGTSVAVVASTEVIINDVQDALDLLGNSSYQGASKVIIRKEHLNPDFFDLKTGMAGEILQKFSNYRQHLAIVGDFSEFTSKSLRDFIYESNKTGRIVFVGTEHEAKELLGK